MLELKVQSFHENLLASVGSLADADGEFAVTAFTRHCSELLSEAGEFDDAVVLDFEGTGNRRRKLKVNGYDLDNADNSVALVVTIYSGSPEIQVVSSADAKAALKALQYFLSEAIDGSFFDGREESSPAYQLAYDLRNRGMNVARYRLYLLTDGQLSNRLRDLPSKTLNGIPVDFQLWDVDRLHQLHDSQSGREALQIDLREWKAEGIPALKVESTPEFATYLASVPGGVLAGLYSRYGSRLLESNVRSYLTNRGKVNKGIRETIYSAPQNFMAFNNGVTATATSVKTNSDSSTIVAIEDLQIVNGGQTTASLFFVDKEAKGKDVLRNVFVPMKLVVVESTVASELVPSISRFANSQNAVSAADFFSNSPYHVRIEELSRRVLAPPVSGATYNTKWYYERTRGQYENERNKLPQTEANRFERLYPKNHKFDKPALAKHIMAWDQRPHIVSAGAQKNFVSFADLVQKAWEKDESAFNEVYFKESVAKGILFSAIHTAVRTSTWYEKAYLANIVAYTVAKIANLVETQGRGRLMDFDSIWRYQAVSQGIIDLALEIGEAVQSALTTKHRATTNVTEWAKKPDLWNIVRAMPMSIPAPFLAGLVDPVVIAQARRSAKDTQKVDNGINQQRRVFEITMDQWLELREFSIGNGVGSPTDLSILDLVTGRKTGFPTERQSARLLSLAASANARGFHAFSP
ncbi:AIPR family protein [Pseudarthrobacter sp. P1]|uniref:AIPR family protein n=1 Tax=Pseudarthrobacter sp. P1 TaxID=3418418 RepID=UPI003CF2AB3E